jgi:hypothetical protein
VCGSGRKTCVEEFNIRVLVSSYRIVMSVLTEGEI